MMANAMTGVETRSTRSRVRDVMLYFQLTCWPKPLYGIDGATVDADLEVERRGAGGRRADSAELSASLNLVTPGDRNRGQVAIKRVCIAAVVDDDQCPESGKRVGVRHLPSMYR